MSCKITEKATIEKDFINAITLLRKEIKTNDEKVKTINKIIEQMYSHFLSNVTDTYEVKDINNKVITKIPRIHYLIRLECEEALTTYITFIQKILYNTKSNGVSKEEFKKIWISILNTHYMNYKHNLEENGFEIEKHYKSDKS